MELARRIENSYGRLPERFFERVRPTPVRNPRLLRLNRRLASELWPELTQIPEGQLASLLSGNDLLPGSQPLAQAYAGHQFGHFVPQLGDGRAVLLGELSNQQGRSVDLQLKGSGPTGFSRGGDGRAALGPVLREYILGEAMHHLGIPTTRGLAIVGTGESVMREGPLPGAVLTRVATSHIRIGTFEYFAARNDLEAIRLLADYAMERHWSGVASCPSTYAEFFGDVVRRQAQLIAQWMLIGFVHGVMNTDNVAISGETLDYGPCAFLDEYDPKAVFSSIDHHGRYAFQNQPTIAQWNLSVFASCLMPLFHKEEDLSLRIAQEGLSQFETIFAQSFKEGLKQKLGLSGARPGDDDLLIEFLSLMQESRTDYTLTFRTLSRSLQSEREKMSEMASRLRTFFEPVSERFDAWFVKWKKRSDQENSSREERTIKMLAINPAVIPRNHLVEQALRGAVEQDDWSLAEDLLDALQKPFTECDRRPSLMTPPRPEEKITATFCGT